MAEDSTTVIDTTKYPYPYEDTTVETLGTVNRESGGNGKTYTYTLTGYGYEYRNDKTISTGFAA